MSLSRRELIKLAGLAGAGGLLGRISGATAATRPIAWRNWSTSMRFCAAIWPRVWSISESAMRMPTVHGAQCPQYMQ